MYKQKLNSLTLRLVLVFITSISLPIPALADSQHVMSGGFGTASNLRWSSSLASSYLSDYVIPAANGWNGISSRVKLTQVSSGAFEIKVLTTTDPRFGVVGEMMPYCPPKGSGYVACSQTTPWGSAQVIGYTNQIANFYLTKIQIISSVFSHEFGHALSLEHNDAKLPSVMSTSDKTTILPQAADKSHLKLKWGN